MKSDFRGISLFCAFVAINKDADGTDQLNNLHRALHGNEICDDFTYKAAVETKFFDSMLDVTGWDCVPVRRWHRQIK